MGKVTTTTHQTVGELRAWAMFPDIPEWEPEAEVQECAHCGMWVHHLHIHAMHDCSGLKHMVLH